MNIKNELSKIIRQLEINSPKIMVVGGVIGVVASGVMACAATLKAQEVVEDANVELETIRQEPESKEKSKALTTTYMKTGGKLALLYLPPVGLAAASIAAILASHNELEKRNSALAAAYSTVTSAFTSYREAVVKKYGEEVDKELRYGLTTESIGREVTDENGKTKKVKEKVSVSNYDGVSGYARYFMPIQDGDVNQGSVYCENTSFDGSDAYSEQFIRQQMAYLNNLLNIRKLIYLNEVYDALGFPKTKAGAVMGWVKHRDNAEGDNQIRIKIVPTHYRRKDGGLVKALLLDFNVDDVPVTESALEKGIIELI